ncbi:MAG: hypothetical protein NTY53_13070 [Kiritimatiellaeota bacterium]|nr:hypothetical protein [Kiritimatiellota bacterium]
MHQHDARHLAFALLRQTEPRKHARRFSLPRQGLEENRPHTAILREAFRRMQRGRIREATESQHLLALASEVGGAQAGRQRPQDRIRQG